MQQPIVAVVTGDVNASSRMTPRQARKLEEILQDCFKDMSLCFPETDAQGFTNFRGDSWQFVAGNPVLSFRSTLFFRSSLLFCTQDSFGRKLHTSAAIGFGTVDFLPDDTSRSGGGEAYRMSGKRLDKLRRRIPGMGVSGLSHWNDCFDCLLGVIDALAHSWTAAQARAVSLALQNLVQDEIGKKWTPPITQQAVNRHLQASGWPAIQPALEWMETTLEGCILRNNSGML